MLDKDIFSQRLIELRTKNNIMAKDVASQIGVSKQAYSLYEKKQTNPSADILIALANLFNVSLDYLTGRTSDPDMANSNKLHGILEVNKNNSDNTLEIILFLIKERGITEKELLKQCNINTSFLTDWKSGRIKKPSYDKLLKIAQYFNASLDYLTGRTNNFDLMNDNFNTDDTLTLTATTYKEKELLENFRLLGDLEQNVILGKISEMNLRCNCSQERSTSNELQIKKEVK